MLLNLRSLCVISCEHFLDIRFLSNIGLDFHPIFLYPTLISACIMCYLTGFRIINDINDNNSSILVRWLPCQTMCFPYLYLAENTLISTHSACKSRDFTPFLSYLPLFSLDIGAFWEYLRVICVKSREISVISTDILGIYFGK